MLLKVLKADVWIQAHCECTYINMFLHTNLHGHIPLSSFYKIGISTHKSPFNYLVELLSCGTLVTRIESLSMQCVYILMFQPIESFL